ncbi:ABC transporter permease [Clostridium folliculivorans]
MVKKRSYAAYPYFIWSVLFIVIPLFMVLFFSFTKKIDNSFIFSMDNYHKLINPIYLKVFWRSIYLAFISTLLCLVIGYPAAYFISKINLKRRNLFILLFILPMWMNFLLRTYAWMSILGKNGFINTLLVKIGLPSITLLYTDAAVLLGMVYNFLPYMVLPIYTVIIKIDENLINAAHDLGANKAQVFGKVIFPLTVPGVISGITMVFMPAVTTFVISRLLGGGQYMLLGNLIEQQFTNIGDWNFGSAISIFMMLIILLSMAIMTKFDGDENKEGGGQVW